MSPPNLNIYLNGAKMFNMPCNICSDFLSSITFVHILNEIHKFYNKFCHGIRNLGYLWSLSCLWTHKSKLWYFNSTVKIFCFADIRFIFKLCELNLCWETQLWNIKEKLGMEGFYWFGWSKMFFPGPILLWIFSPL